MVGTQRRQLNTKFHGILHTWKEPPLCKCNQNTTEPSPFNSSLAFVRYITTTSVKALFSSQIEYSLSFSTIQQKDSFPLLQAIFEQNQSIEK